MIDMNPASFVMERVRRYRNGLGPEVEPTSQDKQNIPVSVERRTCKHRCFANQHPGNYSDHMLLCRSCSTTLRTALRILSLDGKDDDELQETIVLVSGNASQSSVRLWWEFSIRKTEFRRLESCSL
jgi:hypothetical protein